MSRIHADPDFEPRVADWLEADPDSAPAAVLGTVLAALPSIPQRRATRVPWRFPPMSSFAKVAIAVIAVFAVGTLGVIALRPAGIGTVGSAPSPTPTPTLAPTPTPAPSATAAPSQPPPLTGSFTSTMHGISLSYPAGWSTKPATVPWTTGWINFGDAAGDILYDPLLQDNLYIALASQPLAGEAGDRWVTDTLALDGCGSGAPVTVDGAAGRAGVECMAVAVTVNGRGYLIQLYSGDDPRVPAAYSDRAWFEQLLATVQFESPAPSP